MSFFQHALAVVESSSIGDDTRIWAFAHILPGAHLGCECNICDHTFIENDVTIGDRVAVKCGVQLWDGIDVEDDVFIGPNATFTNDPFPRSKQHQDKPPRTRIRKGASIGANATILPGLTIGERSMAGAGAVVTHDVPADAIVIRRAGTFSKKLKYSFDSIFNFTDLPIQWLLVTGFGSSALAIVLGLVVLWGRLRGSIQIAGYTPIVLMIMFFGGLTTLGFGIIGQYLWLSLQKARRRPNFVVRTHQSYPGGTGEERESQ